MTDITINIKTSSDNSEPNVTKSTDKATTIVPKKELLKVETPSVDVKKETTSEPEKITENDDFNKMDTTESKDSKMNPSKSKSPEIDLPKK